MSSFQDAVDWLQVLWVDALTLEPWVSMWPSRGVIRINTWMG
ncbi:hypothetical protein SynROS8604_00159 [Synechococcus sp. ROS8604]|nr:hypothetical protein SynROS8604_00159 [Synechococcus sp. ROS8604]